MEMSRHPTSIQSSSHRESPRVVEYVFGAVVVSITSLDLEKRSSQLVILLGIWGRRFNGFGGGGGG